MRVIGEWFREPWWTPAPKRVTYVDFTVKRRNILAALIILIFIAYPVGKITCNGSLTSMQTTFLGRAYLLFVAALLTLGPVGWNWYEAWHFNEWVYERYPDTEDDPDSSKRAEAKRNQEIMKFKTHSDYAKALWAGMLALLAGVIYKFTGP